MYPEPLEELVRAFEGFPGVGRRTAERLAFHVLREPRARDLAGAIERAASLTRRCGTCGNVTERDPCPICADEKRDARSVLVVEEPRDVEAVERAGVFRGRYHVLMGALQPAEGTRASDLWIAPLCQRAARGELDEIVLGTDPDAEGEATAQLVLESLERAGCRARVTRLARGLPAGSALEYLHRGILADAFEGRKEVRFGGASRAAGSSGGGSPRADD